MVTALLTEGAALHMPSASGARTHILKSTLFACACCIPYLHEREAMRRLE